MIPSAPGRFSTTTGCAHLTDKRSAKSLAVKSAALPVGTGRIRRTARSGQARAEPQKEQPTAVARRTLYIIRYIDFSPSPYLPCVYAGRHPGEYISRLL